MGLIESLGRRKLSVIGIFLVAMSVDVLITNEVVLYDVSAMMGEVFPFVKIQQPTKALPSLVVKLYSWPFYMPLLLGGTLIAADIGKIRKEREEVKVGLTQETVSW